MSAVVTGTSANDSYRVNMIKEFSSSVQAAAGGLRVGRDPSPEIIETMANVASHLLLAATNQTGGALGDQRANLNAVLTTAPLNDPKIVNGVFSAVKRPAAVVHRGDGVDRLASLVAPVLAEKLAVHLQRPPEVPMFTAQSSGFDR